MVLLVATVELKGLKQAGARRRRAEPLAPPPRFALYHCAQGGPRALAGPSAAFPFSTASPPQAGVGEGRSLDPKPFAQPEGPCAGPALAWHPQGWPWVGEPLRARRAKAQGLSPPCLRPSPRAGVPPSTTSGEPDFAPEGNAPCVAGGMR